MRCRVAQERAVNPKNFFGELKRRNVYKIAVAYAVVAWLLIQIATQVFPFFEIPNWAVRLVVLVIMIGFPVALILAWAFELTPEGIKRMEDVRPNESIKRKTGHRFSTVIILAAVIAAGLLTFHFSQQHKLAAVAPAGSNNKSVAVLPFENLSSDKENAFFAQGIQDEIITTLSKISGLRVISRTSTAHYKSAPENLSEIAGELRVANVLEGSVQRSGDRVHINVQLIQAETDAHLWAQSYDRELIDIFSVEGEVAKRIADALRATVSPQEKVRVETKPTDNTDAYVLYLQGREYQTRPDNFLQDFRTAAQLFEQAIALDPNFALAHARLSAATSQIYHWFEPTEARKQKARAEAIESLRLQPDLGCIYIMKKRTTRERCANSASPLGRCRMMATSAFTSPLCSDDKGIGRRPSRLTNMPKQLIRAIKSRSTMHRKPTSDCAIGLRLCVDLIACSSSRLIQ